MSSFDPNRFSEAIKTTKSSFNEKAFNDTLSSFDEKVFNKTIKNPYNALIGKVDMSDNNTTISAYKPSLFERIKNSDFAEYFYTPDYRRTIAVKTDDGKLKSELVAPRGEEPHYKALGAAAYMAGNVLSGATMRLPDILAGKDISEALYNSITQQSVGNKLKTAGESANMISALYTGSKIAKALVGFVPLGYSKAKIANDALSFLFENASDQIKKKILEGRKISNKELIENAAIGAIFSLAELGIEGINRYLQWRQYIATDPRYKNLSKRLIYRIDEAFKTKSAGMPADEWMKFYGNDIKKLQKEMLDTYRLTSFKDIELTNPAKGKIILTNADDGIPNPFKHIVLPEEYEWRVLKRAAVNGERIVPVDPDLRKWKSDVLENIKHNQLKYTKKLADIKYKKQKKEINKINPLLSFRYNVLNLEEKTGLPVADLAQNVVRKANATIYDVNKKMLDYIGIDNIAHLTNEDNKKIISFLAAENADAKNLILKEMNPNTATIALKLNSILQNESKKEAQVMSARMWLKYGKKPANVDKIGDSKKILEKLRIAAKQGRLREHVLTDPDWQKGIGVRKHYYMTNTTRDITHDYFDIVFGHTNKLNEPTTFASEVLPRKGKQVTPKEGPVVSNVLQHWRRLALGNAIADDLDKLYEILNTAELSSVDRKHLRNIFSNLMMHQQTPDQFWKFVIGAKKMFFRTHYSYLNPNSFLWTSVRNLGQNPALMSFGLKTSKHLKYAKDIFGHLLKGGSLADIDKELAEDFADHFRKQVSQKEARYYEFLLQDATQMIREERNKNLANKLIYLLDQTSKTYGNVDELNRAFVWIPQYKLAKDNLIALKQGKIGMKEFHKNLLTDTHHNILQMRYINLIDQYLAGNESALRQFAKEFADNVTEDIHFKYKTAERAALEQTPQNRAVLGLVRFKIGAYELLYYRGIKPAIEAWRTKNYSKLGRSLRNVISGLAAAGMVNHIYKNYFGREAYSEYNAPTAYLIGPGLGTIVDSATAIFDAINELHKGKDPIDVADNLASKLSTNLDKYLLGSETLANYIESIYGTRGLNSYKLLKALLLGKEDWKKVKRDAWQQTLHSLFGSYENPPKKKPKIF